MQQRAAARHSNAQSDRIGNCRLRARESTAALHQTRTSPQCRGAAPSCPRLKQSEQTVSYAGGVQDEASCPPVQEDHTGQPCREITSIIESPHHGARYCRSRTSAARAHDLRRSSPRRRQFRQTRWTSRSAEEWQPERPQIRPGLAWTNMRCANTRAGKLRQSCHAEWPVSDAWGQEHRPKNSQKAGPRNQAG